MGLLSKKPIESSQEMALYSISGQTTFLIVGLGNPGKAYENTRHNIGFRCIDAFVSNHPELSNWTQKKDLHYSFTSGVFGDTRTLVVKPSVFMNNSGQAVHAAQTFFGLSPHQIIVIYDELDLPFGQIRMRRGGGSAGHNGIKSIIQRIGDDFHRIRVGIDNQHADKTDGADFVLKKFDVQEAGHMETLTREIDSILIECIFRGDIAVETRSFIV